MPFIFPGRPVDDKVSRYGFILLAAAALLLVLASCLTGVAHGASPDRLYAMSVNGTYTPPGYNGSVNPANFTGTANLYVIDTENGTVLSAMPLDEAGYFMAVNPSGTRLYVTSGYSANITVINLQNTSVAARIPMSSIPYGIALSPDGSRIFVALPEERAIAVLDTDSYTMRAFIPVNSSPYSLAVSGDGMRLFAASRLNGSISVIFVPASQLLSTISIAPGLTDIVCGWNGTVLVSNYRNETVYVIDAASTVVRSILRNVTGPAFLTFDPETDRVLVTSYTGNNTTVINATGSYSAPAGLADNASYGHPVVPANGFWIYLADDRGSIFVMNTSSLRPVGEVNLSAPVIALAFALRMPDNLTPAPTLKPAATPVQVSTIKPFPTYPPYTGSPTPFFIPLPIPPKVSASPGWFHVPMPSKDWVPPIKIRPVTTEDIVLILLSFIVVLIVLSGITYLMMFKKKEKE